MSVVKKPRRVINLETKLDIIRRSERGFSGAAIARALGLRDSTVRTILKNSDRIKKICADKNYFGKKEKRKLTKLPIISRAASIEVENAITTWYLKQIKQGNQIDFDEFSRKALSVYKELTKDYSNVGMFKVSKEMFEFCKQHNLMSVGVCVSETSSETASADNEDISSLATALCEIVDETENYDMQAVNTFSQNFHEIVEEGGYTLLQIFAISETRLFWKRLPIKSFNAKLKLHNCIDHVTLLLGCNASGDFKLKPLLINLIENPTSLVGYPKDKLPIIWKTNKKASVTQPIFSDWFTSYFCPTVEQYCLKNNLDNKVLLIMNYSPGYPTSLDDLSSNVKVIFLPSKASSLLQPFNDTLMKTFKARYYNQTFSQALIEYENAKPDVPFDELMNSYDIRKAINNITEAWNGIQPSVTNKAWQQLLPNYLDFLGFDDDIEKIFGKISEIAKELNLDELDLGYFHEELDFDADKINSEQWTDLMRQKNIEDVQNDDDVIQIKTLSVNMLGEAIKNIEAAMAIIMENDPDSERSAHVCNTIRNVTASYRQLYRDKRKALDLSIDKYFKNRKRNTESSAHSTSSEQQSTNSNEPQPSNIPVDIKIECCSDESPLSDV